MVEKTELHKRVMDNVNGASHFALYLVAPWFLELATLNYYLKKLNERPVPERTVLVCNGEGKFPTFLRVPEVCLFFLDICTVCTLTNFGDTPIHISQHL